MSISGPMIVGLLVVSIACSCDSSGMHPTDQESLDRVEVFEERLETAVNSINQLTPSEDFNIVEYLYYYNGGGVAATDISGDGLADLYFTNNQLPDRYFVNLGNWKFKEADVGLQGRDAGAKNWSTGVSVEDVNADGLPDIYVCRVGGYGPLTGRNALYVQQRDGSFTEMAADYGLDYSGFNTQAYWFDFDLDGDKDIYLLRHSVHNDATYGRASAREIPDSLSGDKLLRNDNGKFTEVTAEMGIYSSKIGYGLSVAIADYDGNGYPDIYVCNDFSENDYLYLNQQGRGFKESVRQRMGHTSNFSMGSDVADLDGDGRPDLLSLDMRPGDERVLKSTASADAVNIYRIKRSFGYYDQLPRNNLQWNRGGGHFSEIAELAGLAATDWSWSLLAEDFNLDGRPEIFVANGIVKRPNDLDYLKFISSSLANAASDLAVIGEMPTGEVANQLFARTGEWKYEAVDWGLDYVGSSTGAAVADLDGDGDMDLVLNNVNANAKIYENRTINTINAGALRSEPAPGVRRWCAQRGFLSQSQPRSGQPSVAEAVAGTIAYSVARLADTIVAPSPDASFDREPLQPYAGGGLGERPAFTAKVSAETFVASHWGPIVINGDTIAGTEGWWQSLSPVEVDGSTQIIAGNWGLNSSLGEPSKEEPLLLYSQDVDENGRLDPLLTYVRSGKEYSLADKDEIAAQLPGWRRNNLSYAEFSRRSFRENFPGVTVAPRQATTLAHQRIFRDRDGKWTVQPLPRATQITTLRIAVGTPNGILLGGNTLEVLPRIGRQDAAAVQLLLPDGRVQFIDLGGELNRLEVRSISGISETDYRVDFTNGAAVVLKLE